METTFGRLLRAVLRVARFPTAAAGRFLLWLSTANLEVLREFPSDRAKYVGMGGAVLTTASLAGVSATFAISSELKPPMAWAVIFGLLWAAAIMSFDRWLIAAAKPGIRGLPLMAARALIAILIGIVVSTPLVLRIFQPEIDAEIPKVQAQFASGFTTEQTTNERGKRIVFLQGEIATLGGQLTNASFDPTANKDVVAANTRYTDAETAFQTAEKAYLCESQGGTGCPGGVGGSGIPGHGPRAQALFTDMEQKRTARDTAKKDYDDILRKAQGDWSTQNATAAAAINAHITADKAELTRLQGEVTRATDAFNEDNRNDRGLLIQLEALDQLTKDRPTMGVADNFLIAFFTLIECFPILLKTIMSFGRKNEYEEALETYNAARLAVSRGRSREYRAAQMIIGGDLLTEAQAARADRDRAIEQIAKTTISHQVSLATLALNGWYERERRRAEQDPEGYLRRGPSQPPSMVDRHPYQTGLGGADPDIPAPAGPDGGHPDGRADPDDLEPPVPGDPRSPRWASFARTARPQPDAASSGGDPRAGEPRPAKGGRPEADPIAAGSHPGPSRDADADAATVQAADWSGDDHRTAPRQRVSFDGQATANHDATTAHSPGAPPPRNGHHGRDDAEATPPDVDHPLADGPTGPIDQDTWQAPVPAAEWYRQPAPGTDEHTEWN